MSIFKNVTGLVADPTGVFGVGDWNAKSAWNAVDPLGYRGINNARRDADAAARAQYDTNQLNPRREMALQMASEGIRDREMREAAVNRIIATDEASMAGMYGGNAAAMIAGASQASDLKSRALAQYEYDLAIQDAQAKLQGEIEYANVTGDMLKMKAALKSTLALNKATAEAEKGRRKQALIGGVLNMAGTAAAAYIGAPVVPKVATPTEGQPISNYMVEPIATYDVMPGSDLVEKSMSQMKSVDVPVSKRFTPAEQGYIPETAGSQTVKPKVLFDNTKWNIQGQPQTQTPPYNPSLTMPQYNNWWYNMFSK